MKPDVAASPLQYTPRPKKRRRWLGAALLAAVVIASVLGSYSIWQRRALPLIRKRQRQQQAYAAWLRAVSATLPPGQIQYEEDPEAAARLRADAVNYSAGGYVTEQYAVRCFPPQLKQLQQQIPWLNFQIQPPLFFGRIKNSSNGEDILLIVSLISTRAGVLGGQNLWSLEATEVLPTWTGDIGIRQWDSTLSVPIELSGDQSRVEFRAGHVKAGDPAGFEIPYSVSGKAGVIDGSIDAMSLVHLSVRNGPATEASTTSP